MEMDVVQHFECFVREIMIVIVDALFKSSAQWLDNARILPDCQPNECLTAHRRIGIGKPFEQCLTNLGRILLSQTPQAERRPIADFDRSVGG